MDFFTDLMGLILLIVCILIVLIFLKDYTSEPAGDLDNHLARSEVQAALKSGKNDAIGTAIRYSQTLHENLLYVAIPIYENGRLAGVIRTSTSLAPAESAY